MQSDSVIRGDILQNAKERAPTGDKSTMKEQPRTPTTNGKTPLEKMTDLTRRNCRRAKRRIAQTQESEAEAPLGFGSYSDTLHECPDCREYLVGFVRCVGSHDVHGRVAPRNLDR